jgi:hypothetical protein
VLGSYAHGLWWHPTTGGDVWGGVPETMQPFYTICMLLAAAGYFAFSYFVFFKLDPDAVRIGDRFGFGAFNALYALILLPSAPVDAADLRHARVAEPGALVGDSCDTRGRGYRLAGSSGGHRHCEVAFRLRRPPAGADRERGLLLPDRYSGRPGVAGLLPDLTMETDRGRGVEGGCMRLATRLSGIELSDCRGAPVRLGSLWQDQPIVLVFIRHFG